MENLLGSNVTNLIMKEVSSLVADGTFVNTGHTNGLWKIFQDYRLEKFSEPVSPLLTIWCCAHKSSLAWKAASNEIPEIKKYADDIKWYFTYFAKYGVRCRELKHIVEYNNLIVCSFQNIFKLRWSEFTHQLVESILKSRNALIMYLIQRHAMKPVYF